jgi:hypothetical protein
MARRLLWDAGVMWLMHTTSSWSSRGMGGKVLSGHASSPRVPLVPPSARPAPPLDRLGVAAAMTPWRLLLMLGAPLLAGLTIALR